MITKAENQDRCHNKLEIQPQFNRKKEKAKILTHKEREYQSHLG